MVPLPPSQGVTLIWETVPVEGHCLYLIFFPFSVSLGPATEVLEAGTSSLASAAASTTASLVMEGLTSDMVLEAIREVMVEVDMTVVVEISEVDIGIGISVSDSDLAIGVGSSVGVGPTVDMDVSEGVVKSEVIDGVEVGISKSASEYSVGDPA